MVTIKPETIEVPDEITQEQFDQLLVKTAILNDVATQNKNNHAAGICNCCGTTNPSKSLFREYVKQGYEKFHKFIHWQYHDNGDTSLLKEKENMLILRDESGGTMVIGWGDYK